MKGISGRSMIEMLGVLAIIGVLSAGGIMGYSAAMENYKVNKLINDMGQMVVNVDTLFSKPVNTNAVLIDGFKTFCPLGNGIIPQEYCKTLSASPYAIDPYNGGYVVTTPINTKMFLAVWHNYRNVNNRIVVFAFNHLPKSTCVKLLTHDWRNIALFRNFLSRGKLDQGMDIEFPVTIEAAERLCVPFGDYGIVLHMRFWVDGQVVPTI